VSPRLWTATVQTHRQSVREAIMRATVELVTAHGLAAVTMSQVAEAAGVGRATLYKYFPDIETILDTWHAGHVTAHLAQLTGLAQTVDDADQRLEIVLRAYAQICHARQIHGPDLSALLHRAEQVTSAQQQLTDLLRDLVRDAARAGTVRTDTSPDELALYCAHALAAAGALPSKAAVRRLVDVTLAGLRHR
jgi:AcrR family transcriptional regulator